MVSKKKKIFVDGDACPVLDEILDFAERYAMCVIFVHSYAHMRKEPLPSFVKEIVTDPDREAVDMAICNKVSAGDVVITQDLGLAALLSAKQAIVMTPRGATIDEGQADFLLDIRHTEAKKRKAGQRTKGPGKLTKADKIFFKNALEKNCQISRRFGD